MVNLLGRLHQGCPKTTLTPDDRLKAREAIKWLRNNGTSSKSLAGIVGADNSLVHSWYYDSRNPGKQFFNKVFDYYQEQRKIKESATPVAAE